MNCCDTESPIASGRCGLHRPVRVPPGQEATRPLGVYEPVSGPFADLHRGFRTDAIAERMFKVQRLIGGRWHTAFVTSCEIEALERGRQGFEQTGTVHRVVETGFVSARFFVGLPEREM